MTAGKQGSGKRITLSQLARQTADRGLAVLEEHDPEVAGRLSRMRGRRPDKPTVVVVGEAKRGKSSLTNALINVPGLSPVDSRIATSTYIMFRRGPKTAARALLPGAQEPVDVPLDQMRDWATDLGNRGEYAPPRLIEVECDSPLLGNLNLVDTPGVGGLDATHAEIALRAVGRATALLFVCDASAPFTKPELEFLDKASKNIDLVIFAVTKTDAYRGWRQIVEDNRALLREHAPRFADSVMMPVSSKLFEQAALMGASDLGTALREESQITQLQAALQEQVAIKASALHEANLLRTMRSQLDGLMTSLEDSRRACQPDVEYANRLKENRDRLMAARKADSRAWQLRLRSLLSRARLDTMADIQSENRKFLAFWRRQIEEMDKARLKAIGPQLDMALRASSMQIFDRQQARMQGVSRTVLQSMFAQNELAEVYAALQRPRQVASTSGPSRRQSSADEKVLTNISMMSGISITSITGSGLTAATGAAIIAWPIAVAVGVSVAGWIVWARRTASDRNQVKIWLNETLGETRARLEADASAYFIEAEHELTLALDRALVRRIETLDGHIKQIDQSLKVDRGERERRAAAITKHINTAREVASTIEQLLPRLRNAVVQRRQKPPQEGSEAPGTAAPDAQSQDGSAQLAPGGAGAQPQHAQSNAASPQPDQGDDTPTQPDQAAPAQPDQAQTPHTDAALPQTVTTRAQPAQTNGRPSGQNVAPDPASAAPAGSEPQPPAQAPAAAPADTTLPVTPRMWRTLDQGSASDNSPATSQNSTADQHSVARNEAEPRTQEHLPSRAAPAESGSDDATIGNQPAAAKPATPRAPQSVAAMARAASARLAQRRAAESGAASAPAPSTQTSTAQTQTQAQAQASSTTPVPEQAPTESSFSAESSAPPTESAQSTAAWAQPMEGGAYPLDAAEAVPTARPAQPGPSAEYTGDPDASAPQLPSQGDDREASPLSAPDGGYPSPASPQPDGNYSTPRPPAPVSNYPAPAPGAEHASTPQTWYSPPPDQGAGHQQPPSPDPGPNHPTSPPPAPDATYPSPQPGRPDAPYPSSPSTAAASNYLAPQPPGPGSHHHAPQPTGPVTNQQPPAPAPSAGYPSPQQPTVNTPQEPVPNAGYAAAQQPTSGAFTTPTATPQVRYSPLPPDDEPEAHSATTPPARGFPPPSADMAAPVGAFPPPAPYANSAGAPAAPQHGPAHAGQQQWPPTAPATQGPTAAAQKQSGPEHQTPDSASQFGAPPQQPE